MFSWLVVVSFMVAILFFGMFPRSDAFKTVDKPMADFYADLLVGQHLAAWRTATIKDLLSKKEIYVDKVSSIEGVEREGNAFFMTSNFQFLKKNLPIGWARPLGSDSEIKSVVLCVDNATGNFLNTCALDYKSVKEQGTSDYLLTYMVLPENEPYLVKRQLGEKVFLAMYKSGVTVSYQKETEKKTETGATEKNVTTEKYDTTLSLWAQCGMLSSCEKGGKTDFQPGSTYCISNSRYSSVTVPLSVAKWAIGRENSSDILLCMTRLFGTYKYDTSATPPELKLVYPVLSVTK